MLTRSVQYCWCVRLVNVHVNHGMRCEAVYKNRRHRMVYRALYVGYTLATSELVGVNHPSDNMRVAFPLGYFGTTPANPVQPLGNRKKTFPHT